MGQALLDRSAQVWRAFGDSENIDVLDRLEAMILKHNPKSLPEAATMLDVVAVNVAAGQRCDGLDVRAVKSVAAFLREKEC